MTERNLQLGLDFLYARLHGWWSRAAAGTVLDELLRSATEENFFHLLQSRGVLSVTGPERVAEQLLLRQHARLEKLGAMAGGAYGEYCAVLCRALERENCKTVLNYRFFPEREAHPGDALIRFPRAAVRENDLLTLLDATTDEQFLRLFFQATGSPELTEIARRLSEDHDLMRAECAVDNLSNQEELHAIGRLPGACRRVLTLLKGQQIDSQNITTALRNASFYHLDPRGLSHAWSDGGLEFPRHVFDRLAQEGAGPGDVLQAVPAYYRDLLGGETDVTRQEHLLHCHIAHQARKFFYDAAEPWHALAAYPVLLIQETVNLSRIYEGIRFNLPASDIAAMMIR